MFILFHLNDDTDTDDLAVRVARKIIDALDTADKIPDELTEISVGGYPQVWISDEECDRQDALERASE